MFPLHRRPPATPTQAVTARVCRAHPLPMTEALP